MTTPNSITYNFRAGDFIQLGSSGHVYTVTQDVPTGTTTVNVNRPIIDASGSATLIYGPAVTWTVICTEMPQWSILPGGLVSWSGNFTFYEALV